MATTIKGYRNKFTRLKNSKNRKTSSNQWLLRQLNDPFVSKAKIEGYRSRAAYKLLEINEKFKLFKPRMKIVDLGAAPGGWSQVASKLLNFENKHSNSKIIAIDLLEMENIPGVTFIQKDFLEKDTNKLIISTLDGEADIVMSDMAANTVGHAATDHLRIINLCEIALDFAISILKPGGHFIAKVFRGGAQGELLNKIKANFHKVKHFKPVSSRKESSEYYLIAMDRKSKS